jgi:hypothetical protein
VSDPHLSDPDPTLEMNAHSDLAFQTNADPDPGVKFPYTGINSKYQEFSALFI